MSRSPVILLSGICASLALALAGDFPKQENPLGAEPITLQEAVRMALEHAPELALARTQVERAGEALREVRSLNLPQVVTGTGLAYNNGFPLSLEGSAPSVIQFGASQSILSKKNKNLILEAREGQRTSEIGIETARVELAAHAALLYEELHQARKLVSLWSARQEAVRRQQDVTEALLEVGKVRPVDATLARTETAYADQQLLVAQEQSRLAEAALREALGLAAGTSIQTAEPQVDMQGLELPAESLYQRALETQPDIQQAESAVRAKEFHVQAEKGEFYPRLDLIGQYAVFSRFNNYQDYFNRFTRNNYILGLSIQVPLFSGFRNNARVAQSQHEVAEAKIRLQRLKTDLKLGIERGVSQLRVARGALELARLEAAAAGETLEISRAQFEAGRIGSAELEKARTQLREKEIAVVEAEKVLWQRQIELLRLTNFLSPLF